MPGKEDKVDAVLATEGGILLTYVVVATRWSASVIKVSVQTLTTHLGFSFTVIISA